jgi:hypothetical protein
MGNSESRRKQPASALREDLHDCRDVAALEQAVQAAMHRHEEEGGKAERGSDRSFEYSEVPENSLPPGQE